jgi:hypothetical protein
MMPIRAALRPQFNHPKPKNHTIITQTLSWLKKTVAGYHNRLLVIKNNLQCGVD